MSLPNATPGDSEIATAAHFQAYFKEHPWADTQVIQQVLSDALVRHLTTHGDVAAQGYPLLVHQIITDYEHGIDGTTGEPVRKVLSGGLDSFNHTLAILGQNGRREGIWRHRQQNIQRHRRGSGTSPNRRTTMINSRIRLRVL